MACPGTAKTQFGHSPSLPLLQAACRRPALHEKGLAQGSQESKALRRRCDICHTAMAMPWPLPCANGRHSGRGAVPWLMASDSRWADPSQECSDSTGTKGLPETEFKALSKLCCCDICPACGIRPYRVSQLNAFKTDSPECARVPLRPASFLFISSPERCSSCC